MLLTLFDRYGNVKAEIEPDNSSTQEKEIQGDNLLKLSFTLYEFVSIDVNDYIEYGNERYWATVKYAPAQKSTMEWEYSFQLYGIESLIKRFLVLNNTDGENEAVFTLTARPIDHMRLIVKNVNDGLDGTASFKVGAVEGSDNVTIEYTGKYCNEGLKELAEAVGVEWWVEGETVNLCRCEHGDEITLGYDKGLTSLNRDMADNAKFYTRLFPIGSNRNIDATKYGHSRLMLPGGAKYVDVNVERYGIIHHYEQKAFSDIYPRRIGVVSSVRSKQVKDKEGKPFIIYYFKDDALPFNPNDYEIGGLVKHVSFQAGSELAGLGTSNEHYFEVNYDSKTKEFEIITIWPYDNDMQLPGGTLVPKAGDKYILWNIRMPDEYYALAEKELLKAVNEYNGKHALDVSRYKAPTDFVWIKETGTELFIGRRVRLESREYFPENGYRSSRITKISRQVNEPGQMDIEICDALSTGTMAKMDSAIADARNYAGTLVGAINIPDVIRSWDTTKPTDTNLYSARCTHKEFLSKNSADTAQGLITFLRGIGFKDGAGIDELGNAVLKSIQTAGFEKTLNGFGVWLDENGRAHGQIDFLEVLGKAIFHELEVRKLSAIGGDVALSPSSSKIEEVVKVKNGWRCYIKTDDGTTNTFNGWHEGDQAKCQTMNIREGLTKNTANRYYWRCVSEVAEQTEKERAYIVLSDENGYKEPKGTDTPKAGDVVVLCGHNANYDRLHGVDPELNRNRMNFMQLTTSGDMPTIEVYRGVSDFVLDKNNVVFHLTSEKLSIATNSVEWIAANGNGIANVLYMGDWKQGTVAGKNETYYHNGGTWLSIENDNRDEPTEQSPKWKQYAAKGKDGEKGESPTILELYIERGNQFYRAGQGFVATIAAELTKDGEDITSTYHPSQLVWARESEDAEGDRNWALAHLNSGHSINIADTDLAGSTSIILTVYDKNGRTTEKKKLKLN